MREDRVAISAGGATRIYLLWMEASQLPLLTRRRVCALDINIREPAEGKDLRSKWIRLADSTLNAIRELRGKGSWALRALLHHL